MTTKTKKRLDLIPYLAVIISAGILLYSYINNDIGLQKRHIAGLIALVLPIAAFLYSHKLGVLVIGLLLIAGVFGAISFSPSISTVTFGKTLDDDQQLPLLYFQPVFVLWLILHFILSGRYYTGVASKRYWDNIKSDQPMKIGSDND